jgi:hypothetical protein
MKKKIELKGKKLRLDKTVITNLSNYELGNIIGGLLNDQGESDMTEYLRRHPGNVKSLVACTFEPTKNG